MNNYIERVADICSGAPKIKGRRITVYNVVSMLFIEEPIAEYIKEYELSLVSVKGAIEYCKQLQCQKDILKDMNYCSGCILRTLHDGGWNFKKEDYKELLDDKGNRIAVSLDGKDIFFGSIKELEDEEFGKPGWAMAEFVYEKYKGLFSS